MRAVGGKRRRMVRRQTPSGDADADSAVHPLTTPDAGITFGIARTIRIRQRPAWP
jgi:hypothetical protein